MTDLRVPEQARLRARLGAERAAAGTRDTIARHARRRRRIRGLFTLVAAGALVVGASASVTAALIAPPVVATSAAVAPAERERIEAQVVPMPDEGLPAPTLSTVEAAGTALCDDPEMTRALTLGDDAAVLAAAGGAAAFRVAVATGAAPCIPLDDPDRAWVVIDKQRPYVPLDYQPSDLVALEGVRSLQESTLRVDAAAGLRAMVAAAAAAGAGELASESAYRSYATQRTTYAGHVSDRGVEGADLVSARPGYSEHQSGLAVDVVPCDDACATIDDLAASPQGAWVAEHAWEHGWIVRYEAGRTDVSGYAPEPWHLRFIGVELAREYHDGGWTTLEEFFGLPAAPGYGG